MAYKEVNSIVLILTIMISETAIAFYQNLGFGRGNNLEFLFGIVFYFLVVQLDVISFTEFVYMFASDLGL